MTPDELKRLCTEAARRGGEVLKAKWGQQRTIEFKGSTDLVTDADKASEEEVLAYLRSQCPNDAILAEESGASGGSGDTGRRWYIDPLDGTTNYAAGIPHFAVNVAVADEQGMAAAATLDPLRGELFLASRGGGATLNGTPIRCSENGVLLNAVLTTGFVVTKHSDLEEPIRLFAAFLRRTRSIRRFGSSALDMAWVACGRFDAYWEQRLSPWDIAPGLLLVREAGGVVTDLAGSSEVLHHGNVMAASSAIHPQLMAVTDEFRRA